MERAPLTRVCSTWEPLDDPFAPTEIVGVPVYWWQRRVSDGLLIGCVAEEPTGWHLSISFRDHRGRYSRYPRWDEIAQAREQFLPDDVDFVMHLPRLAEYVALHDTTFHLHEHPERHSDG
jgi:hypothetical protein